MSDSHQSKVSCRHLSRSAYLYVRQSSLRQVLENTESTQRQYALKQRAIALGWPAAQIIVIDSDLGQSGASAAEREGFQRLVTEVGLGRAGIVMGLEVSRLARNSTDWHRLLEICALADTLILDEDGVYDPTYFNDRLLLGLKGTMSEAELHVLRARLRGGIVSKARRGELAVRLPIGLAYDPTGRVGIDPDQQVQAALRMLFQTFRRTGSAIATVRAFREQGLRFPRRPRCGPRTGETLWGELLHYRALWILHNPRYAGAYFFGRTRQKRLPEPRGRFHRLPRDEWTAFLPGAHEGYIAWEEFEENQRRLLENSRAHGGGEGRRSGPPREGPALLQGLAICGKCGRRMTVRYNMILGQIQPHYMCQREGINSAKPICQSIPGGSIDAAVESLLIESVSPMALEAALAVQEEIQTRLTEADHLRSQQVERARYEAELARRRFMRVDPENRLVADELEACWNEKIRLQREAEEEYQRKSGADRLVLDDQQRKQIVELATNVPRLWKDPHTHCREKKRMARLIIEDVTLLKSEQVSVDVRFRGGATRSLTLPRQPSMAKLRQTPHEVVAEIDRLLDHHTEKEIAVILNQKGMCSGEKRPFHRMMVSRIRRVYHLKDRYRRLRETGLLTKGEIARVLGVSQMTVKVWRRQGLLRAQAYDNRHDYLYEPPGADRPVKWEQRNRQKKAASGGNARIAAHCSDKVQYEA